MTMDNKLSELIKFLPHRSRKEIAKRAGVTQTTVTKFFRSGSVNYTVGMRIYRATMAMYLELKEQEKQVMQAFMKDGV